jgi:glycine/D-amino acid oxidase-like deaminating enzyme
VPASTTALFKGNSPADAVVIGDGVVGLSTALALAGAGLRCLILGMHQPGAASSAAAGLLAPNIGNLSPDVRALFSASLALYPHYLAPLQAIDPGLRLLSGLIEVLDEYGPFDERHRRLEQQPLDSLQPGVLAPFGAVLHENDAAIDNVRLVTALRRAVELEPLLSYLDDRAVSISTRTDDVTVMLGSGLSVECSTLVVAGGAWTPEIGGLPRPLPIRPLKGQMLSLAAAPLTRPVMAGHVYLVPRGNETVVGATSEEAGFDITVHPETIEELRRGAAALVPALRSAPVARSWAGIRPATPDMLPIIDKDPEQPSVVYAVGHSRNGILLAPLTALAVAELVQGAPLSFDFRPFSVSRFVDQKPA